MEILNLVVGVLAIVISIAAILLSYLWKSDAENNLERVKGLLNDVEKTGDGIRADMRERMDDLRNDVKDRMDDLIRRAVPTQEEEVQSRMMGEFMGAALQNPELFGNLVELGRVAKQLEPDGDDDTH